MADEVERWREILRAARAASSGLALAELHLRAALEELEAMPEEGRELVAWPSLEEELHQVARELAAAAAAARRPIVRARRVNLRRGTDYATGGRPVRRVK